MVEGESASGRLEGTEGWQGSALASTSGNAGADRAEAGECRFGSPGLDFCCVVELVGPRGCPSL